MLPIYNYLNCYYIGITSVFFVDVEVVAKTPRVIMTVYSRDVGTTLPW